MIQKSDSGKKVGILTLPLGSNYGGMLQYVALQQCILDLGFEPILLDRRLGTSSIKHAIQRNVLYRYAHANSKSFIEQYVHNKTAPLFSEKALQGAIVQNDLSYIVVGSDQVWRRRYTGSDYPEYFLHFAAQLPIKKIAYAASFGTDAIENFSNKDDIATWLAEFYAVSVREHSGLAMLANHFNYNDATLSLDPSLLVPKSFYENLISSGEVYLPKGGTICTYLLDTHEHMERSIQKIGEQLHKKIVCVGDRSKTFFERVFVKKPGVESWLYGIKQADFVITDSYHGMLFSIIFEEQFIVIVNNKRGASRFESIAKILHLEDRLVYPEESISVSLFDEKIDFEEVSKKLESMREHSLLFLKDALKKTPTL